MHALSYFTQAVVLDFNAEIRGPVPTETQSTVCDVNVLHVTEGPNRLFQPGQPD